MNTKKLKQLVLDLAIHGKLVPQDPNDEPASELLKRIQASVETHGRASNKSKGKKSAVSSEEIDEVPFEVPEGWCWTKFGEISRVVRGGSPRPAGSDMYYNGPIPFMKVADITRDEGMFVYSAQSSIKEAGLKKTRCIDVDTLVISNSGATLGVPKITKFKTTINDGVAAFEDLVDEVKYYCYWYLKTQTQKLRNIDQGAAQPNLNTDLIKDMWLPLPPLAEQHRIVAAIEKWFAVIDQLEKNEADLKKSIEQTKKKVLDLAIRGKLVAQNPEDEPAGESIKRINPKAEILFESDEYGEVPEGWCLVSVGDLNEYKSGGINPLDNKDTIYELYSVPIYSSGYPEISKGKDIGSTKQKVEKDDVLLCKINPHLNRVWVVSHHKKELQCLASSEWVVLRSSITSSEYLKYALSSEYFRQLLNSNVSGVGGSLTRAQPMFIKKYLIPLPPLAEQKRIVEKIEEVMGVLERVEEMVG